tara:strand:+ start:4868 stop:5131 length:264 start_codon:yes stop_codon:yes gene_type:complete
MKYIHRKIFPSPNKKDDGILTQLWYNYNKEHKTISIRDFTIHFIIDNQIGKNVGENMIFNDNLYMHMVRESFKEVTKILKEEYGSEN